MKRSLLIASLFLTLQIFAQAPNDTSNVQYYVAMMQNKNINFFQTVRAFNIYWQGRDSSVKGCGWKSFKRWEWEMRQIIKPDGSYPDMQTWIADYHKAMYGSAFQNNAQQGGIGGSGLGPCKTKGDWKELGPGYLPYNRTTQPSGVGRLNAVGFHPTDSNTFWVCAPAGGLWKTTNGGKTWSSNTDSLPTLGISAMVVSYRNTDTMYIGTGDRDHGDATGLGVYMSADGGKTWKSRNSGMSTITIARLIMHPVDTRILLAATANGIYRTTNSGGSWSQIVTGSFKDIVYNPLNPNTVYATKDGLFYRSTNGGTSFSQITSGLPASGMYRGAIAVTPNDTTYVYFLVCDFTKYMGTYLSTNGGVNFSVKSTTPNVMDGSSNGSGTSGQAWYDLDLACDPNNKNTLFVGGINIFKSTNAGANWTISAHWIGSGTMPSIHADQHNLEFHPITNKLYVANDGGIFYTPNLGTKWIDLSNGIGVSQLYKLGKSATTKDLLIAGFQDNGTGFFSGEEWNTVRGGDGMDCEWDHQDENYSYGALYYGNITRFYNGTHDKTVANNGVGTINETGDWVTPYTLRPDNTNIMFVGYKNIWRNTAVKGASMSWSKITNNASGSNIRELEISPANSDILYYSRYDNKFFRSYKANGTAAWVDLTTSLPATGTVSAIKCHPTDSNTVYIGLNGKFYRSRNRGVTWTDLSSGLPNNTVNSIALDTSNSKFGMYVGTYTGVWFKDTTSTFSTFNSGLPINGNVTDLDLFYDKRGKSFHRIYAATFSRGTWKSGLYDDGSKKPKTDFSLKLPKVCNDKTYTLTPDCGFNPSRFKWLITPNTYTYQAGTDSLSEVLKVKLNKPGYYNVRLASENCNGSDTLTKQNFIVSFDTIATAASCKTTTTNLGTNNGLGITSVDVNGLKNESSGAYDEGSYMDFSCKKVFFLKPGGRYFTKVSTGAFNNEYVKIYIDYNNNGTLNDAGEEVYSSYKLTNHADTIRCTTSMVKNKVLRMRVVSDFNSFSGPCTTLSYGQSEDYGVFFDAPIPKFTVSKDSACANTSIIVTDATAGIGYNYTWNFGSGATPSTGSGSGPFNVKYSTSGYKKISMTINGNLTYAKDSVVLIRITPSATVFLKKGKLTQCERDTITLAGRDTKKLATSFQWQKANANISGSTDTLLKLWNNATNASGNYRVIASNGLCKDTSANLAILINPMPKVGYTVNNLAQCLKGNKFIITDTTKLASGSYSALYTYSNGSKDTNKTHQKIFASVNSYTLKQTITTNKGCKDSVTKSLSIYPNTTVGFTTNDTDQCKNGNSFVFTNTSSLSSGTYSSAWQYGNSNTSSGTNGSQSYASNGTYNVSLITTTNNNCKDTITKKVIVFASPIAKYTYNDSDQCIRGNQFNYTNTSSIATGSMTYQWNFGDTTFSSVTSPSKKYKSITTTNVKLTVTSNNNCKDSISKQMVVYPNTAVGFNINDTDQCLKGNQFKYTNLSVSNSSFTSFWNLGNSNTSNSTNVTTTYANAGNYTVSLITTTTNNCKDTINKKIIVFAAPIAKYTYNDSDQCIRGNLFNFTNTSNISSGSMTYQWNFGDTTFSSVTSPSKKYKTETTYNVKLTATSNNNCKDSITKQMVVYPNTLVAFNINDSDQCLKGNQFKFTNLSVSASLYNSFWNLGNSNTSTSTNVTASYAAAANYTVTLVTTTTNNCKDTASKKIIVFASPNLAFNANDTDQCLRGNQFKLTNTSNISSGSLNYVWNFGDNTSSTTISPTKIFTNYKTYSVKLKATSNNNCSDSITRKMLVFAMPIAKYFINDSSQCQPINQFTFTNNASIPTGTFTNTWYFGDGNSSTNFASATKVYANAGTYNTSLVSTSNFGCRDTFKRTVEVFNKPNIRMTVNWADNCLKTNSIFISDSTLSSKPYTTTFDLGNSQTSNLKSLYYHYTGAGTYKVLLTARIKTGCEDTMSRYVTILPNPTANFNVINNKQCERNNVIQFANNSQPTGNSYEWNYADGNTSSSQNDPHSFATFGTYTVRLIATHTNGCKDTTQNNVTVYEQPKAGFSTNDSAQCLYPNIFMFFGKSTISTGTLSSAWNFGDNGTSTFSSPQHQYSAPGLFNVQLVISSINNCKDTISQLMTVYDRPSAAFTFKDWNQVIREFTASNKKYTKYIWHFGDGTIGDSIKQRHTYATIKAYKVQLVVEDSNSCFDTTEQQIQLTSQLKTVLINNDKLSIYPNPSSGQIVLHFELENNGYIKYKVYDLHGKIIQNHLENNVTSGVHDLVFDFNKLELAAGTYLFEIETSTGKTTQKVIYTR